MQKSTNQYCHCLFHCDEASAIPQYDLLLLSNRAACVINVRTPSVVCSAKVGKDKVDACPTTFGGKIKVWTENVGELQASMHTFGALNFLNELNDVPETINRTTYGIWPWNMLWRK